MFRSGEIYPDLAVAVLAGGKSTRFGQDKALVRVVPNGPTLIEQTIATVRSLSDSVVVIGSDRFRRLSLDGSIQPDDEPDRGPLGGIATALRMIERPRVLVVACDMPCLSIPLLSWMAGRRSDADVLIPRTGDGRWQPMHAIYRRSALPAVEAALKTDAASVRSIFPHLSVEVIAEAELRQFDPELSSLFSLNRPEDLDRARHCVAGR